jgi:hypothetical protein
MAILLRKAALQRSPVKKANAFEGTARVFEGEAHLIEGLQSKSGTSR